MNYNEYMDSKEWKALRLLAYKRANHKCEYCGRDAYAVHHSKYPKRYEEDHIDNLIVVCKKCHELNHGIREKEKMTIYLAGEMNTLWREELIDYCTEKEDSFKYKFVWNSPQRILFHAHDGGWTSFDPDTGNLPFYQRPDPDSILQQQTVDNDCKMIEMSDIFLCYLNREDLPGTITELFHAINYHKKIIFIGDDRFWFLKNYIDKLGNVEGYIMDSYDKDRLMIVFMKLQEEKNKKRDDDWDEF